MHGRARHERADASAGTRALLESVSYSGGEALTMHISAAPLTPADLVECGALWPERSTYTGQEFARALETCGALLREGRAIGGAIRDARRLSAYEISTFVQERFADEYMRSPHPLLGKRLLLEGVAGGAVLDWRGIAERNAGDGLQLVIVSANYDVAVRDPMLVMGEVIRLFLELHRGYRIARIINEGIGEANASALIEPGVYDVHRMFPRIDPDFPVPSAVCVLTRERVESRLNPFGGMFAYNPPRAFFTRAEQDLLLAALDGAPDDTLSARLGIPLSAVKARWTRIYQRVVKCLPELVEHVRAPHAADRRGAQIRHLVLEYVRRNRSELTPYRRPSRGC
jgi:hypothetical protein